MCLARHLPDAAIMQVVSCTSINLNLLACHRDEAVRHAEAAEQRAREAEAAAAQARSQHTRQSALSEELRQALSQNQQLASQLEEVSVRSSQVRRP